MEINMNTYITRTLGLYGLDHLDAAILAALSNNSTLLMIGPHGSAKTLLAEKVSEIVHLDFRHYNTSLLNYDDLVGYPVPDNENKTLEFIQTPGTIWGAEFILLDEISRARPEIQNKVFPIVYEHKIQGIKLESLKHCWAAMNPPSDTEDDYEPLYSGSWSLDMALADRFQFILEVPGYSNLSRKAKRQILLGNDVKSKGMDLLTLAQNVNEFVSTIPKNERTWIAEYLININPLLEKANLTISGRRARYLFENILSLYSAEIILGQNPVLDETALRTLQFSLPHSAAGKPVDKSKVLLAHKKAVDLTKLDINSPKAQINRLTDPIQKVEKALQLGVNKTELTKLISDGFATLNLLERYCWINHLFPRLVEGDVKVSASVLEQIGEIQSNIVKGAHADFNVSISNGTTRWKVWQRLNDGISKTDLKDSDQLITNIAISRALFFIEKENIKLDSVHRVSADIEERINTCS
jgi:MoxR-like ATPase